MSLKTALEELGFGPCYHMTEVFAHSEHADTWLAAWRGEPVDWEEFLEDYGAAVDWPACAFYGELMEAFPEAKVLLSVRDPERWYQSMHDTIYQLYRVALFSPLTRPTFRLLGMFVPAIARIRRMNGEMIFSGTFDDRFGDKNHAMDVFRRHNEEVIASVPPEKLLVYEVKQGWEPLCRFLDVPVPDEPFPRLNDTAEMRRRVRVLRAVGVAVPAVLALLAAGSLGLLLRRGR